MASICLSTACLRDVVDVRRVEAEVAPAGLQRPGAAHAADGYARATNKASVLLTHLSPGLTNAATGVANAALDSIPMVVIAGDAAYLAGQLATGS